MTNCFWSVCLVLTASVFAAATDVAWGQAPNSPLLTARGPQGGTAATEPYRPPAPQAPFQLTPHEQKAVDQLLKYWELYSGRVKRYRCKFTRWEYDSSFGPSNPNMAKTRSDGEIRYESPDKGLFRVDALEHYSVDQDGKASYKNRPGENGEHWICDGKAIYEFDYLNRMLKVQELPPEMQGKAIADGPLPFLFGAKADKIKQRYWVRIIPPPKGKEGQEYWLQAFPKRRHDAANFKLVEIILDAKLFLPSAIQVYDPSYNGRSNFSRVVYVFDGRKVNERFTAERLNILAKEFYQPRVPVGWKKVVQKWTGDTTASRATAPPPRSNNQATRRPVYGPIHR